jgi:hypothetical protein
MAKACSKFMVLAIAWGSCLCGAAGAVNLVDPGFESVVVASGGFSHTGNSAWTFTNDAGVVRPFTNPTSTGALNTWSATFSPVEGSQYASTYAALDTIRQTASLAPGSYVLSVSAAAPSGSITIPPFAAMPLVTGGFQLTFGAQSSPTINMPPGTDWQTYSATFVLNSPGNIAVGIRNPVTASYFINYDDITLTRIPEPAAWLLGSVGSLAPLRCRRRR